MRLKTCFRGLRLPSGQPAACLAGGRCIEGRPLTPLHGGHIGLLCTAGMLNGIFGEGENRHIAHWQSIKVVDHFEETAEDGTVTQRDRDRFTNRVSLVFADGRTATLGEKG